MAFKGYWAAREGEFLIFAAWTIAVSLASGLYSAADHKAVAAQKAWAEAISPEALAVLRRDSHQFRYALYLRPLLTDGELRIDKTFNSFRLIVPFIGMPFSEIQEWLLRATGAYWRFISEGGITTNIRPVPIQFSGDWFKAVKDVADSCDVIVIVPGNSAGIMDELNYFIEQRTHNVIIIASPKLSNATYYRRIANLEGAVFENLRIASEAGALILPHEDNGLIRFSHFPLTPRSLKTVLAARAKGLRVPWRKLTSG